MKLRVEGLQGGAIVRLVLDAGKGNVIDRACMTELKAAHAAAVAQPAVRAILLDHEGPHFSFGASVPEHLPGVVNEMLPELHALVRQLVGSPVPLVGVVRGACLGGGLEVLLCCTRIVARADAKLGQPEIKLGVFAPVGSVLLPLRVGAGAAASMLLTGESVTAERALQLGLVDELAEDPTAAALRFAEALLPCSAIALRHAHRAVRSPWVDAVGARLDAVERQYLQELMATHDAKEGLQAFVEKRPPVFTHG